MMSDPSGSLWDLVTLACGLAEAEEERRKRQGKAVAVVELGSCSTSGAAKGADGDEEEGERTKRKDMTVDFLDHLGSCSTPSKIPRKEGLICFSRRKRRVQEEGGGVVQGPDSGRLWELATMACWLAEEEEEERRVRKGKALQTSPDVGSCSSTGLGFCSRSGTEKKRDAVAFLDVGPCSTSGAAESADGRAGMQPAATWGTGREAAAGEQPSVPKKRRTAATTSSAKNRHTAPLMMGWVEKAARMGGTCPRLVVKKEMFNTDLDPYYGRLPLPSARPADPSRGGVKLLLDELSPAEIGAVRGPGLPITVLDRWGREYAGANLKRWANKWYVISGGHVWERVVAGNVLKRGDVVEVFHFRVTPRTEEEGGGDGGAHGRSKRLWI